MLVSPHSQLKHVEADEDHENEVVWIDPSCVEEWQEGLSEAIVDPAPHLWAHSDTREKF